MAKRSFDQREENSIIGYLHNVSTITRSGNGRTRYFCGSFQTSKTDVKRLINFSPEKHQTFTSAAAATSPVKITGSRLTPGKNGEIEIVCDQKTRLELIMDELPFKKQKMSSMQPSTSEPKNLEDLEENMTSTVYVKILKLEETKPVNTRFGTKMVRNAVCEENTASRKLTLWQNYTNQVEEQKFYKITNATTNLFNRQMYINTTSSTNLTEIASYGDVIEDPSILTNDTVEIEIQNVQVDSSRRCSNANCLKIVNINTRDPTFRCAGCNMKQLVSKLKMSITAIIKDSNNSRYVLYEPQLKNLLQEQNQMQLMQDTDRLEDYLLQTSSFKIEHSKNNVTSISKS